MIRNATLRILSDGWVTLGWPDLRACLERPFLPLFEAYSACQRRRQKE